MHRCELRFSGDGAFAQHLGDDGRGGTRCLPPRVFELVLTQVRGVWCNRGSDAARR